MSAVAPEISLVVSTIGRPAMLRRLLRSLTVEAATSSFELIVVDQSTDGSAAAVLAEHATAFPWRVYTSGRGVSRGRNRGLAEARAPIVTFPDDDAWFPGRTIRAVVDLLTARPDLGGIATMLWDGQGRPNMLRWADTVQLVTRGNYYRTSIGSTIFVRTEHARAIGGFDENVGTGSGTPYGSCEDSDFVLRVLAEGPVEYHPELGVHHDQMQATIEPSTAEKMYTYGVGQAWFWRRHRYNPAHVSYLLARKVAKVAALTATGRGAASAPDRRFLHGVLDGYTGRVHLRPVPADASSSRPATP